MDEMLYINFARLESEIFYLAMADIRFLWICQFWGSKSDTERGANFQSCLALEGKRIISGKVVLTMLRRSKQLSAV